MNKIEILKKYLGESLNIKKISENNYLILDGNKAITMELKDLKEIEINDELNIVSNAYSQWENRRKGVLNKAGDIIIEFKYKDIYRWNDLFIARDLSDKCGVLSLTGDIIVPFKYNNLSTAGEYLIAQNHYNKYGIITLTEEVIVDFIYDELNKTICNLLIASINNKEGVINYKGDIVIPIEHYGITALSNSLFRIERKETLWKDFEIKDKYYEGVFDNKGNEIIPVDCWYLVDSRNELFVFSMENNSKDYKSERCGIFNKDGEILMDNYDFLDILDNELIYAIKNNKCGFLNLKGEAVLPIKFDKIDKFKNGLAKIYLDGKCGVINTECEFVEPLK